MKALKLKLVPTKRQYKILDEMFGKWASICNRISLKGKTKEELDPSKINKQGVHFNKTQINRAEKDIEDLQRAMRGLQKQKETELQKLNERKEIIQDSINITESREVDSSRPKNFRPLGWHKYHTLNYWNKELEKLNIQISKKNKTIEKIKKGEVYCKPKRVGLWNDNFRINFVSKNLSIKPYENEELIIGVITEPRQPIRGSSLRSKKYIEESITNFLSYSIHSYFFGLSNSEEPLIYTYLKEDFIIPYKKKQREDLQKFQKERIDFIEKKLTWTIRRGGTNTKKKIRKLDDNEKEILEKTITLSAKIINELEPIDWKNKKFIIELKEKINKSFKEEYIALYKNLLTELTERKTDCLNKKRTLLEKKIENLKSFFKGVIDKMQILLIENEVKKVYSNPDDYRSWRYSEEYVNLIHKLAENILKINAFYNIKNYPILIRKSTDNTKKMSNLRSTEWEYYLQISYEPINNPQKIMAKNILGIDRGLTHILAYSVFDPIQKKFIVNKLEPNPIKGWKRKLRKIKCSIQHLERRLHAQKGIHIPENQMKKKLRSIENKIESLYHMVSRKIVNLAKDNNSCIVFEKLEGQGMKQHGRRKSGRLKALNYTLSLFDYGKIASLIKYKAEADGLKIWKIDPAYTSQNCAKCVLELHKFAEPKIILYLDELKEGDNLDNKLLEGIGIDSAIIDKINKKEIRLTGISNNNIKIELRIDIKRNRLIISRGHLVLDGKKKKFIIEEDLAEFQTRKELAEKDKEERIAILDYVYIRGKEKIKGTPKYTGNKKAGYCMKHGQVDADLNASRVIALCKHFGINNPGNWE